jgi:hypothetical protein
MTKTKLTREQMLERLSDYWADQLEQFSHNDLVQFAHQLQVQALRHRNTRDLVSEMDEIIGNEPTDDENDDR